MAIFKSSHVWSKTRIGWGQLRSKFIIDVIQIKSDIIHSVVNVPFFIFFFSRNVLLVDLSWGRVSFGLLIEFVNFKKTVPVAF